MEELIKKIEDYRKELHVVMNKAESYTDPKVVEISQKLDKALNEYGKLAS